MAKKKYTKELGEEIARNIMSGLSAKDAVALAGIDESTYYCWLNPEDKDNPLVPKEISEFSQFIKKAMIARKQRLVGQIFIATNTQWQAAAWYLERVHPEEFGKKEVGNGADVPISAPKNKEEEDLTLSLLKRFDAYKRTSNKTADATDISAI